MSTKKIKRMEAAFNNLKKANNIRDKAHEAFFSLYNDSKYADIELPDDIVETIDYSGSMKFDKFIERMNELLEKDKKTQEEVNCR